MIELKVSDFTEKQIAEFKAVFSLFDKDSDGQICVENMACVMRTLGEHIENDVLENLISEIDLDGNGTIDFIEFLELMAQKIVPYQFDQDNFELKCAFDVFDQDKDGFITTEEFTTVVREIGCNLTDLEIEEMIKEADTSGEIVGLNNFSNYNKIETLKKTLDSKGSLLYDEDVEEVDGPNSNKIKRRNADRPTHLKSFHKRKSTL